NQTTISNGVQCDVTGNMDRTVGAVDMWVGALGISDEIKGNSVANAGAARVHLVNGTHGEVVGAARTQTFAAAEIHLVKGAYTIDCQAMHSTMVGRSEEHTSELQSRENLVCRLLLEKKN